MPVIDNDTTITTNDDRLKQIIYALSQDSPYYLEINPYDGCVKISTAYRLSFSKIEIIKYSVSAIK
jgi:hypothetical protein